MKRLLKNRRGVALMLVLSAITLLTMTGVEFAYNTSVYYNLAQNEADRLKAYYLAKSAYNFMRLELKFDRVFRQVVQSQNLGQFLGANAQLPLCQQFPLSTGLIRAVFMGGAIPGMEGLMGGEEGEEADEALEDMRKDASISQEKQAEEFLQFEGDFDGECVDEGTKVDLNGFAGLQTTATTEGQPSPYAQYKQFLYRFLSDPKFELLFDRADVRPLEVVTNIGDWIDQNVEVNDYEGGAAGVEVARYQQMEVPYEVKNGKLTTLLEAYLIDGVVDEWFAPLLDYFTIYGDGKINICTASEEVVQSLIRRYVDANPQLPPLRLEDPDEMARLTSAIAEACASGKSGDDLKQEVSQALATAIGTLAGEAGGEAGESQADFGSYIRTESSVFMLKLAGQVGDITVRIKTVLDVSEADPKKWKMLYWRSY